MTFNATSYNSPPATSASGAFSLGVILSDGQGNTASVDWVEDVLSPRAPKCLSDNLSKSQCSTTTCGGSCISVHEWVPIWTSTTPMDGARLTATPPGEVYFSVAANVSFVNNTGINSPLKLVHSAFCTGLNLLATGNFLNIFACFDEPLTLSYVQMLRAGKSMQPFDGDRRILTALNHSVSRFTILKASPLIRAAFICNPKQAVRCYFR